MDSKAQAKHQTPGIGIQLYTVRDLTGEDTFRNILRALAEMGFEGVEFAWKYGGMNPAELAAFLDSIGMACCGLHVKLDELLDPAHEVYEYAKATASPFITTSLCSRLAEWDALLPQLDRAAEIAAGHGLTFTYHNHWQEFEGADAPLPFDRLAAETNPELVKMELDIGWIRKAGADPMALWDEHAPRTPQIHLRDYDTNTQQVCDVGDGFIELQAVLDRARELGTQWLIYEQDRYPSSPLASCRTCIERLKQGRR